jgi:enoyl-CoA hydratase/carnithine racemase
MTSFQTIIYEKQDRLGYVTLNRPKNLNVYNLRMRDELYEVLAAIRDDPDVHAVLLKGAGDRAFCAGADLTEFLTAPSPVISRQVRWERDLWGLFLNIPQPTIAALHGYVFGSGIEIALCCDLRIASEDAQFAVPEGTLGIIPAAGATQTMPRTVGRAKALEALLTGERIDAQKALHMGLVNKVVPREQLLPYAEERATSIAMRDPKAVIYVKRALRRGLDMDIATGLQMERHMYLSAMR